MADHSRSTEQHQESDAAASKGCGMFDFLKKKPEDAPSPHNAGVTTENMDKEKKKPSLHLSDSSSSSDEEGGENGEKKRRRKEKNKEEEEKKGIMDKLKEKLPAAKDHHEQADKPEREDEKEKGFVEKMKEKLPGSHQGHELGDDDDKGKEKGFVEKMMEKLPGHTKHNEDDEKKKET